MSDIQLTTAGKVRAIAAIQAVHADYVAKDGLRAIETVYQHKRAGTAAHIYGLAKWAAKHSDTAAGAGDLFCALCRHAEHEYKAAAGLTADKFMKELKVWRVFKSQIKAAMSLGISPLEHSTMHALKKAARDKQGRKRNRRAPLTEQAVQEFFGHATVDSELADVLGELVLAAASVSTPKQAAITVKRALRDITTLQRKTELRAAA